MGLRSEIVRRIGRAWLAAVVPAAALTGCATFAGVSKDLHELTAVMTPNPATTVVCAWQNQLSALPDPTRNGAPTFGIAGQVFLYDAAYQAVDVSGELTVIVSDATPRPPGQAGPTPEVWHFTNSTLKNLRLADERIGRCYVVFLPWPATWKDVTRVRFQARYDQPGSTTLYAQETLVTLDFTPKPGGAIPGTGGGGAVPNPADLLKQARAAQTAGRTLQQSAVTPAAGAQPAAYPTQTPAAWGPAPGYYAPPTGPQPASYPPPAAWGPAAGATAPQAGMTYPGNQPYQPVGYSAPVRPVVNSGPPVAGGPQAAAVPYRPPGTELGVQGPPEVRTQFP